MEGSEFLGGLDEAFANLTMQLEEISSSFLIPDFVGSLVAFAGIFLALWGTWVGIRAILRAGRLVK